MKAKIVICVLLLALAGCGQKNARPADASPITSVWIDTDPSVAPGANEVDDGFALIQAFNSPELSVRGVSVVFGNAPFEKAWPIGREIVSRFGPAGLGCYPGAARSDQLGEETEASRALAQALRKEKLTILALGPVTNVATLVRNHPELSDRIDAIVAVAGRRPGQHFSAGSKQAAPFRDFNFELDAPGFQVLLDSKIPIVLAPWEVSSKVWIRQADLERLSIASEGARYLVKPATDWLNMWIERFGTDGYNPFDTLAVGYVTSPELIEWEELPAEIESLPDDTSPEKPANKPYLLVSREIARGRMVRYCHTPKPAFKDDLMRRLLRQ